MEGPVGVDLRKAGRKSSSGGYGIALSTVFATLGTGTGGRAGRGRADSL